MTDVREEAIAKAAQGAPAVMNGVGHMPKELAAARLRPRRGTISVDAALPSYYGSMGWRVKLAMLRSQLETRFGAEAVVFHTTSKHGTWIGKGKVLAEFRYA